MQVLARFKCEKCEGTGVGPLVVSEMASHQICGHCLGDGWVTKWVDTVSVSVNGRRVNVIPPHSLRKAEEKDASNAP